MKKYFRVILSLIIVIFVSFALCINSFGVSFEVDGIVSYLEWQDCVTDVLAYNTNQSENGISFASIKTQRVDDNTLMLAYCCTDSSEGGYIDDCSVRLSIAGIGTYDFTVDHDTTFQENDLLKIDWETTSRSGNFFIEMRLVFKAGIADNLFFYTFIRDGKSNLSKRFMVTNIDRKQIETTTETTTTNTETTTEKVTYNHQPTTKFYVEAEVTTTSETTTTTSKKAETTTKETQINEIFIENSEKASFKTKVLKIAGTAIAVLLIVGAAFVLASAGRTKKSDEEK